MKLKQPREQVVGPGSRWRGLALIYLALDPLVQTTQRLTFSALPRQ